MKKSQVSMFIIAGIFLTILFLIIMYVQSSSTIRDTEEQLEKFLPNTNTFESQFSKCVQDKVELGFDMLLKQGGVIFKDQGGIFDRPEIINKCSDSTSFPRRVCKYDEFIINYGVVAEMPFIYDIPSNYKGSSSYDGFDTYSGDTPTGIFNQGNNIPYFGRVNLPKLCNLDGPNAPDAEAKFSCLPQLYNKGKKDKNYTVQSQLDNYLEKTIVSCFENPDLVREFDFRYEGDTSIETTFTEDSTLVSLNYSVIYKSGDTDVAIKPRYSFPLRIKKIYTLGYLIAEHDTNNAFFNKEEDYKQLQECTNNCWDNKMTVDIQRGYLGTSNPAIKYDDLVVIEDRSSEVTEFFDPKDRKSEVLRFVMPVQNRRPFLEIINDQPIDPTITGYDYGEIYNLGPSAPVSERTVKIDYKVIDPDEDKREIYIGQLGYMSFSNLGETKYAYYSSPGVVDYVNFAGTSIPISIPSGDEDKEVSVVLACTSQCKQGEFQGKPYHPTIYRYRAAVSDGQYEDYQDFSITVNP